MKAILDFLMSALPWIGIGLMMAANTALRNAKRDGKPVTSGTTGLIWITFACFLFVAIMEYSDGNTAGCFTWVVLGAANLIVNQAGLKK